MITLKIDEKSKTATITLPLVESPQPSASGKTVSIADARNQQTDVVHQGKALKVTAQVYYKP
jgi:hypothetical protein